ncbi:MAG: glycosyltransferase family 2 protein [Acidobacteriaceae bacterium]|nr:glycosyltransferase family 2 protein [Acidobacteriaceae bacterium]
MSIPILATPVQDQHHLQHIQACDTLLDGVTVVIPARNEARSIGPLIARAQRLSDEVIVVDGHSSDGTVAIARDLGASVVMDNGKGKGDAIRVGMNAARYSITVFMDADGSHDPSDIPRLVQPIRQAEYDLVIGSRGRGGSDELHGDVEKLLRMIGSDLILIAINLRWKQSLTDSQNGFRAIRTEVARSLKLKEDITTIEQEMTMKCLKRGHRVCDVPTHEYERQFGESTIKLHKVALRYVYSFLINLL